MDTYVDALGHAWDNGKVTKEPTETETGIRTYACTRCSETKTETIPKLTHEHSYKACRHRADVHGQGLYDPHLRLRRQLRGYLCGRARPCMGQRQGDQGADRDGDRRQDLYLHALPCDQDGDHPGHR
ncbi:MAG: hypothetical protein ACLUNO_03255 [Oscillospiraceae bacterium]